MPYGDWVGPIEYDKPESAPSAPMVEDAPASKDAGSYFGTLTVISAVVGFTIPAAWAGTVAFGVCWLVAGMVAPLEANAKAKARDHGGGGGDVALIGVILLVLVVGCFLALYGLAGGEL